MGVCTYICLDICVFADDCVLFSNSFFIYHYHLHLFVIMLRSTPAPRTCRAPFHTPSANIPFNYTHTDTNGFWPFLAAKTYCVLFNAKFWNVLFLGSCHCTLPFESWAFEVWHACWMQLRPLHTHTSADYMWKAYLLPSFFPHCPFIYIFFGYQAGNYLLFYFVVSWPG